MTYAMTLDNSWELMSEEEMYDVNGGWSLGPVTLVKAGWFPIGVDVTIYNLMGSDVAWMVVATTAVIAAISRTGAIFWAALATGFFATLFATNADLQATNLAKEITVRISLTGGMSLVNLVT